MRGGTEQVFDDSDAVATGPRREKGRVLAVGAGQEELNVGRFGLLVRDHLVGDLEFERWVFAFCRRLDVFHAH